MQSTKKIGGQKNAGLSFLPEAGEAVRIIRGIDWQATALGDPGGWSASLRLALGLLLGNRLPMLLYWGPQRIQFCNDEYLSLLGGGHPSAMGLPGREGRAEIWDVLQPLIDTPFHGGAATRTEDIELTTSREELMQEGHFTIACSPVPDDGAPHGIGGVLATLLEITDRVICERRTRSLSELAAGVAKATTDGQACFIATDILSRYVEDLPFVQLYLLERDGHTLRLISTTGIDAELAGPTVLDLRAPAIDSPWPLAEALRTGTMQVLSGLSATLPQSPPGSWPDPPDAVAVMPMKYPAQDSHSGALVAGISSRIRFDQAYSSFMELTATQVAAAVAGLRPWIAQQREAAADSAAGTQEAQRERCLELEELLRAAPLGVFIVDEQLHLRELNPAAQPLFGDIPDLLGRNLEELMRAIWPQACAQYIIGHFRHTLESGEPHVEAEQVEKRLDRDVTESYEWQINRMERPGGQSGVVCYFRDISAYVEARRSLLLQQQGLEAADRQKDEFLAMLAHELRNPLAPIRNAGELLSRTVAVAPNARAAFAIIDRQVTHLTRLVDDLLDVSRITQGRIELHRQPVDVEEIISRALQGSDEIIQQKGHKIVVVSSRRPLLVNVDPERLVQCVTNILTNAAKYTMIGGEIRIESRQEGNRAYIGVTDNGVGISRELLPRVFELFVQGQRTLDRAQGGLGVGLSIVRRLVDMHGGTVTVSSAGENKGSTFGIYLPLPPSMALPAPVVAASKSRPRRILVVDDNEDSANTLGMILSLEGHQIEVAYSGVQALERVKTFKPEVVLLDIGLAGLNGYDVAARIRAGEGRDSIHLIAITGYGQERDRQRSAAAGFAHHLVKPVEFSALQRALDAFPQAAAPGRRGRS